MFKKLIAGGVALVLGGAIAAGPASAHHSFAMFDNTTSLTMAGTVVSWDWTNPHSFLQVMAEGQHWDLEAASPSMLSRAGMTRNSLKPGDKVTVKMHPLRDKSLGGSLQSVVLADGKTLSFEPPRQQPQPQ
jgi:hypothetical protein